MADSGDLEGESGAPRGLRLVTLSKGPEGFGFRMYTNKHVEGQHIEAIIPGSPAESAGLCVADHILQVNGVDVGEDTHKQVVARITSGDGKDVTLLVVDPVTEQDMKARGEELSSANATVLNGLPAVAGPLKLGSMADARPKKPKKREVKEKDWAASVQAFGEM